MSIINYYICDGHTAFLFGRGVYREGNNKIRPLIRKLTNEKFFSCHYNYIYIHHGIARNWSKLPINVRNYLSRYSIHSIRPLFTIITRNDKISNIYLPRCVYIIHTNCQLLGHLLSSD